jgi:hypothetical protein
MHHACSTEKKLSRVSVQMVDNGERLSRIRAAMVRNLARTRWLGDFDPMPLHCPLFGQHIATELVPDLAEAAWSCDGLGYAWSCIEGKQIF